jgi:hypothetical protein
MIPPETSPSFGPAGVTSVAWRVQNRSQRCSAFKALFDLGCAALRPPLVRQSSPMVQTGPPARSRHVSLITGAAPPPHRRRRPASGPQFVEAVNIGVLDDCMAICFPRKPLRGAVNGMTWPPCSIGSGAQICPVIQSIHMVRAGVGSRTISASLLCSFSLISRVTQRVTSITV